MYTLEVEREIDISDHSSEYKLRAGMIYNLEAERKGEGGRHVRSGLQLQKWGRDDIQSGGGEKGTCQFTVEQGQR